MMSALVLRNLRVFWRDRTALIVTIAGPIVFAVLFLTCLRGPLADTVAAASPDGAGVVPWAIADGWCFASAAALSALTSSISFVALIGRDRRHGRWGLYGMSSAKPWQVFGSYLMTVALVVFIVSLITVALGQIWAWAAAQPVMSPLNWLLAVAGLILTALFFAGLALFAASFRWSRLAFGAYCLFGATLIGFLAWTATSPTSTGLPQFFAVLPFAEQASLLRHAITTASGSLPDQTARHLGIQLGLGDGTPWSTPVVALLALAWAIVAVIVGCLTASHKRH